MTDQELHTRVETRVENKLGFYIHLAVYLVINLSLVALNLSTSPASYWFQWPLIGWGIGLVLHALIVFLFGEGSAIRERMIDQEMKREALKE